MRSRPKTRGDAGVTVLAVLAVVALAGWLGPKVAPKIFDSRTKDAEVSKDASANVEKRVEEALEGERRKGSVVAASLQTINSAASEAPPSPWADFVRRESAQVLPLLPAPDYKALYAAEARKRAVLEGKLDMADKLYREDAKDKQRILAENAGFREQLTEALQARREADARIAEAAAYARGKDAVIGALCAVVVLLVVLWLYTRFSRVSLRSIGVSVADIREGSDPIQALDRILSLRQQAQVAKIVKPNQ